MIRKICVLLILFISQIPVFGNDETNDIASIIKVWGFLNYNSPHVLKSDINWDQELINAIELYDLTKSHDSTCTFLLSKLPELESQRSNKISKGVPERMKWIYEDTLITDELRDYLSNLIFIEKPFPNRYIYLKYSPVIGHSNPNKLNFDFNNKYHRLLNLARYWTIIQYFNPYLELLDSWDTTLIEMIPVFINSKSEVDFYKAMLRINSTINDSHSFINIFPLSFGKDVFGKYSLQDFKLSAIGDKIFISQIRQDFETDVRTGDILIEIDETRLDNFLDSAKKFASLSFNDTTKMLTLLTRSNQVTKKWTLIRGNDTITSVVNYGDTPLSFSSDVKDCITDSFNNSYYFMPNNCMPREFKDNMRIARKYDGVILDMRCYPKGLHGLITSTFSVRRKHFVTLRCVEKSYPGFFYKKEVRTPLLGRRYKKKVVVLVSAQTVSASEYSVMALQTNPLVKVIGTHTGGTNGDVVVIPLHGGYTCSYSSVGIYYPDGIVNHHNGNKIDIQVVESIEDHLKMDKILEIGKNQFSIPDSLILPN